MAATQNTENTEKVRKGQRFVIFAILLNLAFIPLNLFAGDQFVIALIALAAGLAAFVLSILGIVTMASGLGYSILLRVALCILAVIPLIGLITLLILNGKATKHLRENGYQVGLFGAPPRGPEAAA